MAPTATVQLLHDPERIRVALSPLRRQLLERLQQPSSATELAAALGMSRQRINYHLRALERAGLVRLLTFTIEADVGLGAPGDVERFTTRLAGLVEQAASEFNPPSGGRRYRVVVGGHPRPRQEGAQT